MSTNHLVRVKLLLEALWSGVEEKFPKVSSRYDAMCNEWVLQVWNRTTPSGSPGRQGWIIPTNTFAKGKFKRWNHYVSCDHVCMKKRLLLCKPFLCLFSSFSFYFHRFFKHVCFRQFLTILNFLFADTHSPNISTKAETHYLTSLLFPTRNKKKTIWMLTP